MKKRLLSTLLILCVALALLPGTVCAATAQPELKPDIAEIYLNVLRKNEESILKQD